MTDLLHLLEGANPGGAAVLAAALLWVGGRTARERPSLRAFAWSVTAVLFVSYVAYALGKKQLDLSEIALRGLIGAGCVLGVLWTLLPPVVGFYEATLGAALKDARRLGAAERQRRAEGDRRRREEADRRRRQEEDAHRAPERERERLEAEGRARLLQEQQWAREEARIACELLYQLHAPALGERFPRATFDDFVRRHLSDGHPPEEVALRAEQLKDVIRAHLRKVEPEPPMVSEQAAADRDGALAGLQAYYDAHPELHEEYPPFRFRAELRVRVPPTATADQAWQAVRELMADLQGKVQAHRQRQEQEQRATRHGDEAVQQRIQQLQAEIARLDQRIAQTEQALPSTRATGVSTHLLERQLAGLRHQRAQYVSELDGLRAGSAENP